jgi:hypothetical protein
MGEIRSKQFILRTAILFSCGGLLVACAGDPPKPAPVAMGAPPPIADSGPSVMSGSPLISSSVPVRRSFERPASQSKRVAEGRPSSKHLVSSKKHHHSVKATHHKAAKQHIAHKGTARKQAKVSAVTKTAQPKS